MRPTSSSNSTSWFAANFLHGIAKKIPLPQTPSSNPKKMFIVHVHVHVKDGTEDAFRAASQENARNSVQEPGIARFDVCQQTDDPTRFLLIEVDQASKAQSAAERDLGLGIEGSSVLEILESQRRAVNARGSLIRLRNQRLQNRLDLHLALGGDYETVED